MRATFSSATSIMSDTTNRLFEAVQRPADYGRIPYRPALLTLVR
jgi:hypothetical protein